MAGTDAFDDADDLPTADQRADDKVMLSTVADAVAIVTAFRTPPAASARTVPVAPGSTVNVAQAKSPWTFLDRSTVADGLEVILNTPRAIRQTGLNLCGPAAFFNIVIGRHPVAVAQAATTLFNTGSCKLGNLAITPNRGLLTANYGELAPAMSTPEKGPPSSQAVWMLLGALRNTASHFWQPDWVGDPNQNLAGMSPPSDVAGWFNSTGFFASVKDGTQLVANVGIPAATNLTLAAGTDNALLINANLLFAAGVIKVESHAFILSGLPNHWITLIGEVVPDTTKRVVTLSVWTWGFALLTLSVPFDSFISNYYGAITTTLPASK